MLNESPDDLVAEWKRMVPLMLMALREFEIPLGSDITLDYSARSLQWLENVALDRLGVTTTPHLVIRTDSDDFAAATLAYLGESLMATGDGSWYWDACSEDHPQGLPVVRSDSRPGADPARPHAILRDALRARDGQRFSTALHEWRDRASLATRAISSAEHSSCDAGQAHLALWLACSESEFSRWKNVYAATAEWDFSPASLPTLEDVVRTVTPTAGDLDNPIHRVFRDAASWYLGEVMRRGLGGRWAYNDGQGVRGDIPEYVAGLGPWDADSTPVLALHIAIDEPGFLRTHYDNFSV